MPKHRTITLTNRPPVRIAEEDWPVVAQAKRWDNTYEFQANRTWTMRVRQHEDGRAIVYAIYDTRWQGEDGKRAGVTVEKGGDIPAAINHVAELMGWDTAPGSEAADCIANLPAIDLV